MLEAFDPSTGKTHYGDGEELRQRLRDQNEKAYYKACAQDLQAQLDLVRAENQQLREELAEARAQAAPVVKQGGGGE